VNVPQNLELFNHATVLKGNSEILCKNLYFAMPESERAAGCVECGTCEDHCPQHIPIRDMLKKVDKAFR
jgi:predicted aldo/keto reductase-like oxidoreductase